ncbi:MAG: DUF1330 domain-containing protein [Pseudomonadota bacterium]
MSDKSPVYLLALLKVEDLAGFLENYAGPLGPINARHGVEAVLRATQLRAIEGSVSENVAAVLRFPSEEALDAWYNDPDYAPLIEKRLQLTDGNVSRLIALTPVG